MFKLAVRRLDASIPVRILTVPEDCGIDVSHAVWPRGSVQGLETLGAHCYLRPCSHGSDEGSFPAPPYEDSIKVSLSLIHERDLPGRNSQDKLLKLTSIATFKK